MSSDSYFTISFRAEGLCKNKGSRFLAFAHPVASEPEAKILIDFYRKTYHDARHHCFAWVLGDESELTRSSDDGEPSGTAGKPILNQITSRNLTNTLVNAETVKKYITVEFCLRFPYTEMNTVMKILKELLAEQSGQVFDTECRLTARVRKNDGEKLIRAFSPHPGIAIQSTHG
jgi:putative IMPACT (imprinted ancient) family translation regulator